MSTSIALAEEIEQILARRGYETELMVHPGDERGAILGAARGDDRISITVAPTQLALW